MPKGKARDDGKTPYQIEVPEEYVLRDEVRWLKTEDAKLFRFLKEVMNKIEPAYVSTYPPSECGIATFTRDVLTSVAKYTPFSKPTVVAVKRREEIEPYGRVVRAQIMRDDRQSYIDAAKFLNKSTVDIISIQHEYGIYGGTQGEYILDFVRDLEKPAVATLHTVLLNPNEDQKRVLQELAELCQVVVVMVRMGRQILTDTYGIDPKKVTVIQHGVPNVHRVSTNAVKRALAISDRKIISTFGLINRGKGIEIAIEAVARVVEKYPNALYLVLGETHPGVRAWEGEAYRNDLLETVRRLNLENHVRFNNRFLSLSELVRYLCATDVYVTPYLNKDQICSGTLAYALGCGKAVVSTPYLYAEEVLGDGRGVLVDFRSPEAMADAIIDLFDNTSKKEQIESLAYKYGRRTAWFNVAIDYLDLFHRVMQAAGVRKDEVVEAKK
ncbi:MAG: glycosyltransferase family 4 protein [Armatimonadetes bacterium]|nr:glycosyltransferase family 4 protein [Armatimonadota bacterium]